jgi:hypothetical protein
VALATKSRKTGRYERDLIDRWRVGCVEIAREPSNGVPLRPGTITLGHQGREFERFAEVKHANLSRRCLSHQQVAPLECSAKDSAWMPLRGQATPLGARGRRLHFVGHYPRAAALRRSLSLILGQRPEMPPPLSAMQRPHRTRSGVRTARRRVARARPAHHPASRAYLAGHDAHSSSSVARGAVRRLEVRRVESS